MKIFLDTSALFKLYHQESDSHHIESLFSDFQVTEVFLSEITKLEFASTVWKKFRLKEVSQEQVLGLLATFEKDFEKYTFVQIDNVIVEQARILLTRYGTQGLRTLDSVQLSTAILLNTYADLLSPKIVCWILC